MKTVVVAGGGPSGLACAWRIRRELASRDAGARVLVLESGPEPGGCARTDVVEDYRLERGPNGFLDNEPRTLELVDELGMRDRLLRSDDLTRRRFIYKDGRLHLLPESPRGFLGSTLLSPLAKARVLSEVVRPARRDDAEETVGAFGRRRLGAAFTSTFLDPMVSGIYAGNVDELSLPATFPKIVELEREYGGLFRGMAKRMKERKREAARADEDGGGENGARTSAGPAGPGGVLHSFDGGVETLVRTLSRRLGGDVHVNAAVTSVRPLTGGGFEVEITPGSTALAAPVVAGTLRADAVVLATPGHTTAPLVAPWEDETAAALAEIPFAPISVVCLGFDRDAVGHPLDGFGALIPRNQRIRTLGVIFTSTVWSGRAAPGKVLLRAMIGGARDRTIMQLTDRETIAAVRRDLDPILSIRGEPSLARVYRWPRGIPQYTLGHMRRLALVDRCEARHAGLALTGNSLRGISLNHCVKDAWRVGKKVAESLVGA